MMSAREVSGILIVDKPSGYTSHDVVALMRRLAGQRRVGHAGTLDPLATGVLVLLLGQATRLSEYLLRHDKAYRAVVQFGQARDTDDADGRVLAIHQGPLPSRAAIEAALPALRGAIQQMPPAYAAIKIAGQPAYRRARRGENVSMPARSVQVYRLELVEWETPRAVLEVECSAGVYVRSLARDLGNALGCGAFLAGLTRTRSGPFSLDQAAALDDLLAQAEGGAWRERLLPLDAGLADWDALYLTQEESRRLMWGQGISRPAAGTALARAYDAAGAFMAIVEFDVTAGLWRPQKVLTGVQDANATHSAAH